MTAIRLGVNIDHVATLRQVRRARYPDMVEAMSLCERGGADQITVHLREDRRHIQDYDVTSLLTHTRLPINLEMAFTEEMVARSITWTPYSVTLVPERREEMTTESGLDLRVVEMKMPLYEKLTQALRVYGFIDADRDQVERAAALRMEGVEFHTGHFAQLYEESLRQKSDLALRNELERLQSAAELATEKGLEVKAGHGLTLQNVRLLLDLPALSEVNIGHSIVARAIMIGLEAATREMKNVLAHQG